MLATQCREPERTVLVGILLSADTQESEVEQPKRGSEHPLRGDSRASCQVFGGPCPRRRKALRHDEHPVVLVTVTLHAPGVVVAVLTTSSGVGADA